PNCFDQKRNQDEIGVDCVVSCGINFVILNLEPIQAIGLVKIFGLDSGQVAFLAEIKNPNSGYAAEFLYNFFVYDRSGNLLETISGSESVHASERKFIYTANASQPFQNIGKVDLRVSEPRWVSAKDYLKPDLALPQNFLTEIDNGKIKVSGSVRNQGPVKARSVKIIAVIFDKFGLDIFASQTVISTLDGFDEKSFLIYFPPNRFLFENFDPQATKIFINAGDFKFF
ncbi:MAG: hypothetical protein AAB935_01270, partial [Patescibacteria group bacterium]